MMLVELLMQLLINMLLDPELFRILHNCTYQIYTVIFASNSLVTTYCPPYVSLNTYHATSSSTWVAVLRSLVDRENRL